MRLPFLRAALTLVAIVPALARAQSQADSIVERCITRDTSTAWREMQAEWSRERPGSWSNDSLRNVLIAMGQADQAVRPADGFFDSIANPAFVRRMHVQDSINAARLREIIDRLGWPTRSMVGARGASAAFLIAQHNASLQPLALRLMKALPAGEVQQSELAMLEDRILVSQGKPQKYGTQLTPSGTEFFPIDTVARLDARRAAVGLPPMPVYLCMIRAFTGRDVRVPAEPAAAPVRLRFKRYWTPHARLHVGQPQLASVALGGMYVIDRTRNLTRWSGPVAIVEPGVRAGKVRLGYGSSGSRTVGISATASYMYFWGDEGEAWAQPGRRYAGGELHISALYVDIGFGWYQSVPSGKLRFAFSVGAGL